MKRIILSVFAALGALAGAASAKTIVLADVIARNGGVPANGLIDLGPVTIQFFTPAFARDFFPDEDLARSGGRWRSLQPNSSRVAIAAERASFTAIHINGDFKITNLKFNDGDPGDMTKTRKTLVVNGVAYHFSKIGGMTLTDSVIVMRRGGSHPSTFTLEAFDIEALATPIPAASILMLAGLAGIGFAMRRKKPA